MNYINVDTELFELAREPTSLNYGEIILLALIRSMPETYMTNEMIAKLMNTSVRTVKRWIANLIKNKLVTAYYDNKNGVKKRFLSAKFDPCEGHFLSK